MAIHILPDTLASQIAAGEVVERPASVVKELVENALDAGASSINVEVRGGGRELIQVADDGAGIEADEVEIAFQRHATSKLHSAADLTAIRTLGFRGEALAAISAVSQVTVVTRAGNGSGQEAPAAGTRLVIHGGRLAQRDSVGAPQGTLIAVENLFYNVPARLKFLKSANSEKRLIDEFVTRYALAYPQVRFRLSHNGRITFQSAGNGQVRDVLAAVYGPETARQLLPIAPGAEKGNEEARVAGFASPPSLHRANRSQITLFVNGRWIKDTQLAYAVIQAYRTLLPVGRFPLAVLFLSLPYDQVDVNVHPAKTEVRFRQPHRVFGAVQRAVHQTLLAQAPVRGFSQILPGGMPTWGGSLDRPTFARRDNWPEEAGPEPLDLAWQRAEPGGLAPDAGTASVPPAAELGGERLPLMRVVGQVGAAYIITEGPDGLFLIDQHAAHERILYEQFMAQKERDGVASQGLVAGVPVHLTPAQATLLEEHLETLAGLGFALEPFGPNAFMVRAVPALLARQEPAQALLAVVEDLERGDAPMQEQVEARLIRRVCKAAAIKAGQALSPAEMQAMVQQLETCQNPHTCPHGRPTLIHLSLVQLAREFGRL